MAEITLYSYWRSSCSYRVRIALEIKALSYEIVPIHLVRDGGEQRGADYRALNPMAQVPTLVHKGLTITQSAAIIEYLDVVFPEPRLIPADPAVAAVIRRNCELINAGIQPLQNLSVLQELERRFDCDAEGRADWSRRWLERGFAALERHLEESAGVFSHGDELTATDCYLVPQVYNARRFSLDLEAFPLIARIDETCRGLAAFGRAEPSAQPDAT